MKKNKLLQRLTAITRTAYLILERVYRDNNAWIIHAWPLEILAEDEDLPEEIRPAIAKMRTNLYSYIASIGGEWSPEEENTILLRGGYIEAAKTLKALWLGLHLVLVLPADMERVEPPSPEEVYPAATRYMAVYRRVASKRPAPYQEAERLLDAASALALASGYADPAAFHYLGVDIVVADMLYVLSKVLA